jgi:hypothetical protein
MKLFRCQELARAHARRRPTQPLGPGYMITSAPR